MTMHLLDDAKNRTFGFALAGAVSGAAAAAACIRWQLGEVAPLSIGGYCLGVLPIIGRHCGGVDGALYIFPGLVFGIVFGPLLNLCSRLDRGAAVVWAAAAIIANAAAVFVCILLLHPIDDALPFDILTLDVAIAGVPAGAAGAGVLCAALRLLGGGIRPALPIAAGAGLGLLVALMPALPDTVGVFAFYMLWQAGYAAALAAKPQRES